MTESQRHPRTWITNPDAYRKNLETLLGDGDPLAIMAQTADTLAGIVAKNPVELLRTRPFPGKWTPSEIIGHLVDAEWVYGYRFRLILSEERPPIRGTEQERWVSAQGHNDRDPEELVEEFEAMRRFNLSLWRRLGPEELSRVGEHNERGTESLGQLLRMVPGHDLSHIGQINRYLDAARKG